MTFSYYEDLSPALKRVYRRSESIEDIPLKKPAAIHADVIKLNDALTENDGRNVAKHASKICNIVCEELGIAAVEVKVKSKRPSNASEELQGLYEFDDESTPVITVWMKTAQKKQVVAFKSFIRTILHELCHHIDYEYFSLEDSLHTQGFFKRESNLYKTIVPAELQKKKTPVKKAPKKKGKKEQTGQLDLFIA